MWSGIDGLGWGWIGLVMLHVALFWVLVVLCIAVLVGWLAVGPPRGLTAIDILKARYAKGELTREQFDQLKRELAE